MGDYINRGPESLECVSFLQKISREKHTFVLKGNLERLVDWYLYWGEPQAIVNHFQDHKQNLFCQWANKLGVEKINFDNFSSCRELLKSHYSEEIYFLRNLPIGLDSEDFIFTHSGIGARKDWQNSTEQEILKNDPYLCSGLNMTEKWSVVGHMPVWNCPESLNTNNPIIYRDRKIIGVDGGAGVKQFSQINALIIEHEAEEPSFSNVFLDDFPKVSANSDFTPDYDGGCFKDSWPNYTLELLKKDPDFSLCCKPDSKEVGLVKNEHLGSGASGYFFSHSTVSTLLEVKNGEQYSLLDINGGNYCFVKNKNGEIGWVRKNLLSFE